MQSYLTPGAEGFQFGHPCDCVPGGVGQKRSLQQGEGGERVASGNKCLEDERRLCLAAMCAVRVVHVD